MHDLVFLFDVDNTLIDNDRIQQDLREHLEESYGRAARDYPSPSASTPARSTPLRMSGNGVCP